MRRLWLLFLGAGLLSPAVGCGTFKRHTAGVCDCNPPPVETVLSQPCPQHHPVVNPYGAFAPIPAVSHGMPAAAAPGPVIAAPGGAGVVVPGPK